jgi:hypothetical protein
MSAIWLGVGLWFGLNGVFLAIRLYVTASAPIAATDLFGEPASDNKGYA